MPELRYIKKLSKLVCLATGKLENKHSGKDYFSLTAHKVTRAFATHRHFCKKNCHTPHVPPPVILLKTECKKGVSFSFC